ncbi:MAG: oligosaccharide flippase family protein [Streptosporangiales bacterium]
MDWPRRGRAAQGHVLPGQSGDTALPAPGRVSRILSLPVNLRQPGVGQNIARTAGFNVAATIAAGLGGILLARAAGPTVRGEYAGITAWLNVAQMAGGMGQPAALCFYVARDPERGAAYAATSRAMMLLTGALVIAIGWMIAPVLAHGDPDVTMGYRIMFGATIVSFVGASYTFSLQATDLIAWNVVRLSQPVLGFAFIAALWWLHLLTLDAVLLTLAVSMFLQLVWAYRCCRRVGLAPGRAQRRLLRPLATYGVAQIAALTPAALNAQLDQLVLSQTVPAADLGRYAVAVSLTLVPIPLVAAIGNVAFPHLAAQRRVTSATLRLQSMAILSSGAIAAGMLLPIAAVAPWLIPLVFGPGYRGAVPLLWLLTPGAIFLACGQVVGDLLRGRNKPAVVAWSQGLAAVFTVVLLFVLLPVVGVAAASIASTVAYGIALGGMLHYLRKI